MRPGAKQRHDESARAAGFGVFSKEQISEATGRAIETVQDMDEELSRQAAELANLSSSELHTQATREFKRAETGILLGEWGSAEVFAKAGALASLAAFALLRETNFTPTDPTGASPAT